MAACWPLKGMSPAQKAVLISLADQANDDGVCWPAVGTIADRTCLSERAVRDALGWLQAAGIVARTFRANNSTSYTITPGNFRPDAAPVASKRVVARATRPADAAPPADAAGRPANAAPPGGQMPPPNRKGTVTEPSIKKSACAPAPASASSAPAPAQPAPAAATRPSRPDDVAEQTWADWLQLRKAKRAPVTLTVLDGARSEAAKAGLELEAFLQLWCMRGSQGLQADWLKPAELQRFGVAPAASRNATAFSTILEA